MIFMSEFSQLISGVADSGKSTKAVLGFVGAPQDGTLRDTISKKSDYLRWGSTNPRDNRVGFTRPKVQHGEFLSSSF
jgi:hypothetical protein